MKLSDKLTIHKPNISSREFFSLNEGIKCVHYGDIYKNYSGKTVLSSRIINSFINDVSPDRLLRCDSIIVPDVTETVSDWGHFTYIQYDGTPYFNGTHAIALTSDSTDELRYLFRYLASDTNRKRLQSLLNGSTVFQISVKDFNGFLLDNYHESQEVQRHIVDILGTLDDRIENCNNQIQKLNSLIALLFNSFNAKDCKKDYLKNLCSVITKGTTPTTINKDFVKSGIPFIKVESLTENHQVDDSKLAYIDEETNELLQRSKIRYKDCLVSIAGTIGRFALLPAHIGNANTNQAIAILRAKDIAPEYLYAIFLSGICNEQIKAKTVQAVQANLSLSVIGSLEVPIIMDQTFLTQLYQSYELIEHLLNTSRTLRKLKEIYLKKFFG